MDKQKKIFLLFIFINTLLLVGNVCAEDITLTTLMPGGAWLGSTDAGHGNDIYAVNSVDPVNGNVGIGTTAPSAKLQVNSSSTRTGWFINTATSGSISGGGAIGYSDDGSALASGDRLGFFLLGGQDGNTDYRNSCGMTAFATENWNTTAAGARLDFETTANGGTTRTAKVSILGNGNVGINKIDPTALLYVQGQNGVGSQVKFLSGTGAGADMTVYIGGGPGLGELSIGDSIIISSLTNPSQPVSGVVIYFENNKLKCKGNGKDKVIVDLTIP